MKTVCVYHSIDLDGWMSAAIVKHWFEKERIRLQEIEAERNKGSFAAYPNGELDFIGYNYGQPIPDLSEYDQVIMCDISLPKEHMLNLWATKGLNFIWIDHHISAIKEMENAHENISSGAYPIQGCRNTKFSACELTWLFFMTDKNKTHWDNDDIKTMPEIVRLLGRYDCFGHKGTDEELKVLEFQYGARAYIQNYEEAYNCLMTDIESNGNLSKTYHDLGKPIYQYLCTEANGIYKRAFSIRLESTLSSVRKSNYTIEEIERYLDKIFYYEDDMRKRAAQNWLNGMEVKLTHPLPKDIGDKIIYNFLCVNQERFNPINFGIDYHKDGYDGFACFHFKNDQWHFSLYNDNGKVDCSAIAKQFGGGGHKGAAGFIITDLNKIIKNDYI